jgi:hypothetical protein
MYKPANAFVFPHLVFLKDVSFRSWSEQGKTTKLYKFDWEKFDEAILKEHIAWNAKSWPNTTFPFVQKFNSYYETILRSLRFAIPQHYLTEIRRMTQMAVMEWGVNRPFDTNIRDMCLGPAIKCIQVAFELIADCAYDEETNYFLRVDNKYVLPHMLLFRFWQHQTGSGMIMEHSDFNKIESRLGSLKRCTSKSPGMDNEIKSLEKFINFFAQQAEDIQSAFSDNVKMEVGGSASGPVVAESKAPENKSVTVLEKIPGVFI